MPSCEDNLFGLEFLNPGGIFGLEKLRDKAPNGSIARRFPVAQGSFGTPRQAGIFDRDDATGAYGFGEG